MSKKQVTLLVTAGFAVAAWISFAEHPDAARLRTAILDTLGLL